MSSSNSIVSHYVNGQSFAGNGTRLADVFDPSTGAVTRQVKLASKQDVRQAIKAAHDKLPEWSAVPPAKRAAILFEYRNLILKNMDELAMLLSAEHGKTLIDAKGSITRGLEVVEFACGIPHLLKGSYSESVATDVDSYSLRQPVGVCVGITPFNFPAMVPMWMFPLAIACGNTFVLKPSEKAPSCPIRLVELMSEAGLPDGVLNLVNGDKEAVDTLITDPLVDAVSFVGSTAIGQYIYETGCAHGKRVQALCGAKNHMVIMPDADFDKAADAIIGAAYGSAGERCMAISVVVAVGDETADEINKRLKPRIESLKVGPYSDESTEMGPLVTQAHLDKVRGYVDAGVAEGADLVVDGRGLKVAGHENGAYLGGCLFDNVKTDMKIYKEEIFGPVLSIVRSATYGEALEMINNHEYGNGVAIFTRDGDTARHFTSNVQIGMVGVNVPIPVPVAYHSFGGWKRSLFGDHSVHGTEGVHFYTRLKTITARWPSGIREGAKFHFSSGSEH